MRNLEVCRLYGFIDEAYRQGRSYETLAKALCNGGVDIIQLRMKEASSESILEAALIIQPITSAAGVHLVINDELGVASQIPDAFLHQGQEDFFDAGHKNVRDLQACTAGSDLRLGLSTHAPEQARKAISAGADYIAIGPVFATPTKPTANPVTLEYVKWASKNVSVPWFCIGGINLDNLDEVLQAGAQRICVVSAILNAANIEKECAKYQSKLETYLS
ncbi:thiamine phosphate synthase [Verrucomicrobia bacterium]|nr:thiamine phosphate synthase [Verrucomicrobiota bacterium]